MRYKYTLLLFSILVLFFKSNAQESDRAFHIISYWKKNILNPYTQYNNLYVEVNKQEFYEDAGLVIRDSAIIYVDRNDKKKPFMIYQFGGIVSRVTKDSIICINTYNESIFKLSRKSKIGKDYFFYYVSHNIRDYYFYPYPKSILALLAGNNHLMKDTIVDDRMSRMISYQFKNSLYSSLKDKAIKATFLQKIWINPENHFVEKKTISRIDTASKNFPHAAYTEYNFSNIKANFEKKPVIMQEFDFSSPKYKYYTFYDENTVQNSYNTSIDTLSNEALDRTIYKLNGDSLTLRNIEGWILLDFWRYGCPPCFEAMKIKDSTQHEFDKRKITVISLNPNNTDPIRMAQVCKNVGISTDVYYSKEFTNVLSAWSFPTFYLINPLKKIVLKQEGLGRNGFQVFFDIVDENHLKQ